MRNFTFTNTVKKIRTENLLLIISLLLVIIPHFFRLPALLILFCSCILLWRLFYEAKIMPLPGKILRFILMITAIVITLFSYQTIVGQNAGTALLVVMLCLKLTEFNSQRDAMIIVFLGYFTVVTGFLFSQSIPMAFYMLTAAVFLTSTLIAFQHKSVSQLQHIKLATQLLAYSVPLAIILFFLFPRVSGPLWGLPSDAFSTKTGMSDTMSPGSFNNLAINDAVAFRIKFDSKIPEPEKRYWRGPVLWSFNGRTWSAPKRERKQAKYFIYENEADSIDYTITLEPHNQYWLFALDIPSTLPDNSRLTPELQIISRSPVKQVKRYSMTSYTSYKLPLYQFLPINRYFTVPENLSTKTRDLVKQWQDENLPTEQIVNKALNYFIENEFYYSRKPPLLFEDPVDEFLFETRKGYCEHYSSAFTVLMRLAGIPARVVTGYYGGEMNPLGDYMIVRQSDAHAWSEVYLENKGWVRIDPTSVIPPHRILSDEDVIRIKRGSDRAVTIMNESSWIKNTVKNIQYTIDTINDTWNQWVVGYNDKKQVSLFRSFGIPAIDWKGLSILMFGTLALLMSIISFYIFRESRKLDPVNKIYKRFCKKMTKVGFDKQDSETANQFAVRIVNKIPDKKLAIMKITTTYNNLHYGKYKSRSLLSTFAQQVNELKL